MKTTISKTFDFDAAHSLPFLPEGHKCRRLHGHTYRVEIRLTGYTDEHGMLLDYQRIADAWAPICDKLDHRNLNDIFTGLAGSTTETLAAFILAALVMARLNVGQDNRTLGIAVRVYESSTTWAEVSG